MVQRPDEALAAEMPRAALAQVPDAQVRSLAEIAALFDITDRETDHLHDLEGCVARIQQVQAAKVILAHLSGAQLREALELRRGQPRAERGLEPA